MYTLSHRPPSAVAFVASLARHAQPPLPCCTACGWCVRLGARCRLVVPRRRRQQRRLSRLSLFPAPCPFRWLFSSPQHFSPPPMGVPRHQRLVARSRSVSLSSASPLAVFARRRATCAASLVVYRLLSFSPKRLPRLRCRFPVRFPVRFSLCSVLHGAWRGASSSVVRLPATRVRLSLVRRTGPLGASAPFVRALLIIAAVLSSVHHRRPARPSGRTPVFPHRPLVDSLEPCCPSLLPSSVDPRLATAPSPGPCSILLPADVTPRADCQRDAARRLSITPPRRLFVLNV